VKKQKTSKPGTRSSRSTTRSALTTARQVLRTEADAISALIGRLDDNFARAVELLAATKGRVIVTGMGKSGLVARKIAATLSSTGTPAFFLHPAEAIHGDLGKLVPDDTVIALSYSGETHEIFRLVDRIKRLGIPLISMTGNSGSTLAQASDVLLDVSIAKEACPMNLAPTASTTASLALGDALAVAVGERKGFREDDFAELHPGGELGRRLRRVEQFMHPVERLAVVRLQTPMPAVIEKMSRAVRPDGRAFGIAVVVENGRLAGVITDGDLRRLLQSRPHLMEQTAGQCMTRNPLTIGPREFAARGVNLMESRKINALPVVSESGRLEGLLHLHDLLQLF
jgi:arabinose-5-phosphate isomerase